MPVVDPDEIHDRMLAASILELEIRLLILGLQAFSFTEIELLFDCETCVA